MPGQTHYIRGPARTKWEDETTHHQFRQTLRESAGSTASATAHLPAENDLDLSGASDGVWVQ